jgi:hypothetical protein
MFQVDNCSLAVRNFLGILNFFIGISGISGFNQEFQEL